MSKIDPKVFDWSETYAGDIARKVIADHLPRAQQTLGRSVELVLEMGAGNCDAASYVHEQCGCNVIAVDPFYKPQRPTPDWLEFYRTDAESFDYGSLQGKLDLVYSLAVVDYLPPSEFRHFCHEALSTLKPGGVLMFDFVSSEVMQKEKHHCPYSTYSHNLTWIKSMPGARKITRLYANNGYNLILAQK